MSGFAEYSQKLINKYKKKYKVPIVVANDENIKKYGRLIKTYDDYLLEDDSGELERFSSVNENE